MTVIETFTLIVRISRLKLPDRPVPVLEAVRVDKMPGMAQNVYENLIKMTPKSGVDIVTNSNWKSIRKERFVDSKSNHMFVRVDHGDEVERCDVSQLNLDYDWCYFRLR